MPAPLSFLDALKAQAEGSAVSTAAPLTFGKALAQSVEKGHFRHADGKFRVGTPVALADLEDIAANVPDDDAGLLDAMAKFQAGEVPPPIDIAVDPDGNRALVRGKKRLAAARKTGQASIPVRFTQVKEVFGKADSSAEPVVSAPPRTLQPIDDKTSYPPFPYDQTVFARLRPDQVPRFLGVLTDRERWPLQPVKLDQLLAMQNRVDTGKVMAKVENGGGGHEPIVVMLEPGRLHIADGHHDLAAAWLRGEDEKAVRFADLTPVTNVLKADMPVAPGALVRVKEDHRADNWFLEQVGDALGEVIASWIVQEGENTGKVSLAVEWLTPGICGMYRGLDAAKVEVVTEDDRQGVYSSVVPDAPSAAAIAAWLMASGVPNAIPSDKLHATIVYSRAPVPAYVPSKATVTIDPASFRLGVLDGKLLVLNFDSPDLTARHNAARFLGATWDHPTYQPHITLSSDIGGFDWSTLAPPAFPITLGDEAMEPLNVDWKPSISKALRCAPNAAYARAMLAKAAASLPAVGDLIDFDDDRFTDKGPASGTVAFVVPKSKTPIVNFGDGYPEDLETIYWPAVTKKAKAERWTKPSGKVVWSVHGKPDDQQEQPGSDGVSKGAGAGTADHFTLSANISKVDDDKRLVFGWFSIVEIDGQPVTDREGDRIAPDELEPAAYGHVLNARVASDTHVLIGVGKLVESCVFTLEKQQAMVASLIAMGIPAVMDLHCVGWWGGYYITDDKVWAEIKAGNYVSFSIGGTGTRTPAA